MYDMDNLKEELLTYLGADDPKYNNQETFTVFEVADLYHNFMPDPTDEVFSEERKKEYSTQINEFRRRLMGAIATQAFNLNGVGEIGGITWMSRQAIYRFFELIDEPCPTVFHPRSNDAPLPPYLDPDHEYYCSELDLAIKVCEAIYVEKDGNQNRSLTTRIKDLLDKRYKGPGGNPLPAAFLNRMAAICNSKPPSYKKAP